VHKQKAKQQQLQQQQTVQVRMQGSRSSRGQTLGKSCKRQQQQQSLLVNRLTPETRASGVLPRSCACCQQALQAAPLSPQAHAAGGALGMVGLPAVVAQLLQPQMLRHLQVSSSSSNTTESSSSNSTTESSSSSGMSLVYRLLMRCCKHSQSLMA
jgi:hypothetical protein